MKAPFGVLEQSPPPLPSLYISLDNGCVPFTAAAAAADSGLGYVVTWSV